jgi:hypothetical protein
MTQMSVLHPLIWDTSASPMTSRLPVVLVLVGKEVILKWLCSLLKMARTSVNIWLVAPLAIAAIEVSYFHFDLD